MFLVERFLVRPLANMPRPLAMLPVEVTIIMMMFTNNKFSISLQAWTSQIRLRDKAPKSHGIQGSDSYGVGTFIEFSVCEILDCKH